MLVMNKVLNETVSEFIIQMFKPQWSPTENQAHLLTASNATTVSEATAPITVGDWDRKKWSAFRVPTYFIRSTTFAKEGPFHNANYVFAGALVNTHFINLIDILNNALKTGAIPEYISVRTESYDPAVGIEDLNSVIVDPLDILTIGEFANSNYALVKNFENGFVATGTTTSAYVDSQNLPELLTRLLFSVENDNDSKTNYKQILAKKILLHCGLSATVINDAFNCFFPFEQYNTTNLTPEFTSDGKLNIKYEKPIKLQSKYIEAIHNPAKLQMYLYFPFINSALVSGYAPKIVYESMGSYGNTVTYTTAICSGEFFSGSTTPTNAAFQKEMFDKMPTLTDKFYSDALGKYVVTIPYTAITIGKVGTPAIGANGAAITTFDIETDYIDKIDYIDGFNISIQTPYIIN